MGVSRRAAEKCLPDSGDLGGDKLFVRDVRLCDGIALTPHQVSRHLLPLSKTRFLGHQGADCRSLLACLPSACFDLVFTPSYMTVAT